MSGVRVCIVRGTWQFVTLLAALEEHAARGEQELETFLLHGGSSIAAARRAGLTSLGERARVERTLWIDDLTGDLVDTDVTDVEADARAAVLRARVGTEVAEVWTNSTRSGQNWLVHHAFPGARVVAYEDGLLMYVDDGSRAGRRPGETAGEALRRMLRAEARRAVPRLAGTAGGRATWRLLGRAVGRESGAMRAWRVARSDPRSPHAISPSAAYLVLGGLLSVSPLYRDVQRTIEAARLERVLRALSGEEGETERARQPRALVLSRKFAAAGPDPADAGAYARTIEKLHEAGYAVCWKDHPRTHVPILDRLRGLLPSIPIDELPVDPALPVELALVNHPVDLVVSAWSSTMFYAQVLWGTQPARIDVDLDLRRSPQRALLVELVRRHVPDLDTVLGLRAAGTSVPASGAPAG